MTEITNSKGNEGIYCQLVSVIDISNFEFIWNLVLVIWNFCVW